MKRVLIVLLSILLASSFAQASFSVSGVSGGWGTPSFDPNPVMYSPLVPGGTKVWWGTPLSPPIFGAEMSNLEFFASGDKDVELNDEFYFGKIRHENRVIMQETKVTVDLNIDLMIDSTPIDIDPITVIVDETSNSGSNPDDTVTLLPTSFGKYDLGNNYWFHVIGFGAGDSFSTQETDNYETHLIGKITRVPAPGAILLGSFGVVLVGWTRKRYL